MAEIRSREDLRAWLEDKPREWAQIIAARAALRALPFVAGNARVIEHWPALPFAGLRGTAISWAARNIPAHDMVAAADAAAAANANAAAAAANAAAANAAYAADAAYAAARAAARAAAANAAANAAYAAAYAAADAANAAYAADAAYAAADAANAARATFWQSISADIDWLVRQENAQDAARLLSEQRLWPVPAPESVAAAWQDSRYVLRSLDPGYQVWIDWYERRIEGHDAAFDITGDIDRAEDKAILIRLADATNAEFWDRGPEYVNAELTRWLEAARARAARNLIAEAPARALGEIAQELAVAASPVATITDDRLDAVPNAQFDQPEFGGDLADLPSELRAYIAVVRRKLPRNVSRDITPLLDGYDNELAVRGTRPILNILKAMASSLHAELWKPPATPADDPDNWQLRSPEEWGPGAADLWRTFFKAHLHLIEHFPLDSNREALIAATLIDEVAASGKALTEPVDAIADLIVKLGEQGFATPNIVRIIEAHQQYNLSVAGLPLPDQDATIVSPKRRHVLMTIGFWFNLLSVLGGTATLADSQTVAALITALQTHATDWLNFIRP